MDLKDRYSNNLKSIFLDINSLNSDATLVCVTKNHTFEELRELYFCNELESKEKHFGENRVQEFLEKYEKLKDLDIKWHIIGHLQTNKVKYIVGKVFLIHSVDSIKLLEKIDSESKKKGVITNILIQVNTSNEEQKFGCSVEEAYDIIERAKSLENIVVNGLMCMAMFTDNEEIIKSSFLKLKELYDKFMLIKSENFDFKYISMGMSNDYKVALKCGSNMLRIGSAIFR